MVGLEEEVGVFVEGGEEEDFEGEVEEAEDFVEVSPEAEGEVYVVTLWHMNFLFSVFMQAEDHRTFGDQHLYFALFHPPWYLRMRTRIYRGELLHTIILTSYNYCLSSRLKFF